MLIEESEKALVLSPNPNDGKKFDVTWGNSPFVLTSVKVINQQRKIVRTPQVYKKNLNRYSIRMQQTLTAGLYFVRLHYDGKDEFLKLIVQ